MNYIRLKFKHGPRDCNGKDRRLQRSSRVCGNRICDTPTYMCRCTPSISYLNFLKSYITLHEFFYLRHLFIFILHQDSLYMTLCVQAAISLNTCLINTIQSDLCSIFIDYMKSTSCMSLLIII